MGNSNSNTWEQSITSGMYAAASQVKLSDFAAKYDDIYEAMSHMEVTTQIYALRIATSLEFSKEKGYDESMKLLERLDDEMDRDARENHEAEKGEEL